VFSVASAAACQSFKARMISGGCDGAFTSLALAILFAAAAFAQHRQMTAPQLVNFIRSSGSSSMAN
jgi:hypothetical protein